MLKQNIFVPIWNHLLVNMVFVSFDFLALRKNHPFVTVTLQMCETSSRMTGLPPKKTNIPT